MQAYFRGPKVLGVLPIMQTVAGDALQLASSQVTQPCLMLELAVNKLILQNQNKKISPSATEQFPCFIMNGDQARENACLMKASKLPCLLLEAIYCVQYAAAAFMHGNGKSP